MKQSDLFSSIPIGEISTHRFKTEVHDSESQASEIAALANTTGGTICKRGLP